MKFLAVLCCVLVAASAEDSKLPAGQKSVVQMLLAPVHGVSSQYRSQDNQGNYAYGYDESHATGSTYRRERGSPGIKVGSYGLMEADGRIRMVNYVADELGYRVDMQTNEPGVEAKEPASTSINRPIAIPVVASDPDNLYSHRLPDLVGDDHSQVDIKEAQENVSQDAVEPQLPTSADPEVARNDSQPPEAQLPPAASGYQVVSHVVHMPQPMVPQLLSAPLVSHMVSPHLVLASPHVLAAPQVILAAPQAIPQVYNLGHYQTYISHASNQEKKEYR